MMNRWWRLPLLFMLLGLLVPTAGQAQGLAPARPRSPAGPTALSNGCPTPTVAQCSDPAYLYESRCGQLDRQRSDSRCAAILEDGMEAAAARDGEELAVVPPNLDSSGVGYVVPSRPSPAGRYYVPDLTSVHSSRAASSYATVTDFTLNEYEQWVANGTAVSSCREYVWERFADINEFLRAIRTVRDDFRAVYEVAYGPASNRASIGTRHLQGGPLRGRDGRSFGTIFGAGSVRLRSSFYALTDFPGYSFEFPPPTDVPGLVSSIAARSLAGGWMAGSLVAARAANRHRITESWAWHRTMSERWSYQPPENGLLGPQQLAGVEPERGEFGFSSGQPGQRRYLDDELDELWRLQLRFDELVRQWKRANLQFQGSGWTVRNAGLGFSPILIANPNRTLNDLRGRPPARVGRPAGPIQGPATLAIEDPETVIRRRILDDMIAVLGVANTYGCLNGTDSPCDWSPARFGQVLLNNFGPQQDLAMDRCMDFTAGNLQNVLNRSFSFVDDPEYPDFACSVTTGSSITGIGLDQLEADVDYCREVQLAYRAAFAADEARDRVRTIPELVDPATGEFVLPGIRRSRDELMGNEYFGLGYNYELGFEAGVNQDICQIDIQAVARAKAFARVFGQELILLDMGAEADTVERTVDIWARVASKNIFVPEELIDPISLSVAEVEPLEFDLIRTFEKTKEQKIIETTIIIVVVPLSLEAGIAGRVGVDLGLTVLAEAADNNGCPSASVGGVVRPFLGVDGYVAAALDVFIAEVGIRGDLNIITVSLPFRPSIGVRALRLSTEPEDFELNIAARLDLELSTLSGTLSAYAEIGWCPFCYTGRFTLVEWEGPKWVTNLFDQTYTVTLADLFAAFRG